MLSTPNVLRWSPGRAYEHVHPLLRRIASTVLALPHADVAMEGAITYAGRRIDVRGARGGQAHLWGTKQWRRVGPISSTPSARPSRISSC
jgi:hypothetical protein